MKKILLVTLIVTAFGGAQATENSSSTTVSQAGPVTVNSTNTVSSGSTSSANATGGSNGNQSMVFSPTYNTPDVQTINQNVTGTTTSNVNQNVTGTQTVINKGETTQNVNYGGSQTLNQNVSGTTTQNINNSGTVTQNVNQSVSGTTTQNINNSGTTTQNVNQNVSGTTTQNQNVKQEVNGTTTQNVVSSGGTHNTVHQTFGSQTIKNTPSVSGPPLTASNDTCMGSASGSVNAPGFGLSLGKTYVDPNCVMLKNSRELWNMGMKAAAMARMCMDEDNRKALEMTGFVCPQSGTRRERADEIRVEQTRTEVVVPASTTAAIKE